MKKKPEYFECNGNYPDGTRYCTRGYLVEGIKWFKINCWPVFHRDDGPAVDSNGTREWWKGTK